jgi:hypothetical protein
MRCLNVPYTTEQSRDDLRREFGGVLAMGIQTFKLAISKDEPHNPPHRRKDNEIWKCCQ